MAQVQLIPSVAGDFTIPAVGIYPAQLVSGVRMVSNDSLYNSFDPEYAERNRAARSHRPVQDPVYADADHVGALLALPEYDPRRVDFLSHVTRAGEAFVGFIEPVRRRLENNTDRSYTLPAYGGYPAVTVRERSADTITFAGHLSALAAHPEPAVQQALAFITAWPV